MVMHKPDCVTELKDVSSEDECDCGALIKELRAALRDCIPFVAVQVDRYRHEYQLDGLHPTHAEILDRASVLSGGEPISQRLK